MVLIICPLDPSSAAKTLDRLFTAALDEQDREAAGKTPRATMKSVLIMRLE